MKFFCHALFFALASSVPALFADGTGNTPKTSNPPAHTFAALLKNTPFKPAAKKIAGGKPTNANYRFLGILTIAGETEFCVYDTQKQRCRWLKLRHRDTGGIVVESYDPEQKSLNLQTPSGSLVLTLPTPEEKPLANSPRIAYRANVATPQTRPTVAPNRQTQNAREVKPGQNARNNQRRNPNFR